MRERAPKVLRGPVPRNKEDDQVVYIDGDSAPRVLFSAAVPYQAGEHHVFERYQGFWCDQFRANGFVPIDCVRARVWNDDTVAFWYAQNTLLYVRRDLIGSDETLKAEYVQSKNSPVSVIHPRLYCLHADPSHIDLNRVGLKRVLLSIPWLAWRSFAGRVGLRH